MKRKHIIKTLALTTGLLSFVNISGTAIMPSIGMVEAYAAQYLGVCTDNQGVRYRLFDDGTATVAPADKNSGGTSSNLYKGGCQINVDVCTIPDTIECDGVTYKVTEIGEGAFFTSTVRKFIIGNNVTYVDDYGLYAKGVEEYDLGENVKYLDVSSLNCKELKRLKLPKSLEKIIDNNLTDLEEFEDVLIIPENVTWCGRLGSTSYSKDKGVIFLGSKDSQEIKMNEQTKIIAGYTESYHLYSNSKVDRNKIILLKNTEMLVDGELIRDKKDNKIVAYVGYDENVNLNLTNENIIEKCIMVRPNINSIEIGSNTKLEDKTEMKDVYIATFYDEDEVTVLKKVLVKKNSNLSNLVQAPIKENYTFKKWSRMGSTNSTISSIVDDCSFYAEYTYTPGTPGHEDKKLDAPVLSVNKENPDNRENVEVSIK